MHSKPLDESSEIGIDDIDRKIIAELNINGRISYTDLAKEIGLSRVAVQSRINALMDSGVIERFTAVINPERIGIQVSAFSMLRWSPSICTPQPISYRRSHLSPASIT